MQIMQLIYHSSSPLARKSNKYSPLVFFTSFSFTIFYNNHNQQVAYGWYLIIFSGVEAKNLYTTLFEDQVASGRLC